MAETKLSKYPWTPQEKLIGGGLIVVIALVIAYVFGDAAIYALKNIIDASWLAAKLGIGIGAAYLLYGAVVTMLAIPGFRDALKVIARAPIYGMFRKFAKRFPISLEKASLEIDKERNTKVDAVIKRLRQLLERQERRIKLWKDRFNELTGMLLAAETIGETEVATEAHEASKLLDMVKRAMGVVAMLKMSIINGEKVYKANGDLISRREIDIQYWEEELETTGEIMTAMALAEQVSGKSGMEKMLTEEARRQIQNTIADNTAAATHSLKALEPLVKKHGLAQQGAVIEMQQNIKTWSNGKDLTQMSATERQKLLEEIPELNAFPEINKAIKQAKAAPHQLHRAHSSQSGALGDLI